jgi:hypothetical protein|tara:strand:+ start:281 stop:589 length:309 start_codon:yes stop_codon:yes gene_type:complete
VNDPLLGADESQEQERSPEIRRRFELAETGFNEIPRKYRKFYRKWQGEGDTLAPNEVLCPVCMIVVRSSRELRVGDRVYCMPCMSRLMVAEEQGMLVAKVVY